MSIEENKAVLRRMYEEVYNHQNIAALDELLDPNFIDHEPEGDLLGTQHIKAVTGMFLKAFPDGQITIGDLIAEGNKVVGRFALRGTHQGTLMGRSATGKTITLNGIHIVSVVNGKITEQWAEFDTMNMMKQIGAGQ